MNLAGCSTLKYVKLYQIETITGAMKNSVNTIA